MDIEIFFYDRTIEFESVGKTVFRGEGLDELLAKISKYGTMINKVEIKGQSKSFTFTRQVYLFANILSFISGCEVIISGRPIRGEMVFPIYENKI